MTDDELRVYKKRCCEVIRDLLCCYSKHEIKKWQTRAVNAKTAAEVSRIMVAVRDMI